MSAGKLKIPVAEQEKYAAAAQFCNLKFSNPIKVGNMIQVDVTYKTAQDLVDLGGLVDKIDVADVNKQLKTRAEKEQQENNWKNKGEGSTKPPAGKGK